MTLRVRPRVNYCGNKRRKMPFYNLQEDGTSRPRSFVSIIALKIYNKIYNKSDDDNDDYDDCQMMMMIVAPCCVRYLCFLAGNETGFARFPCY